MKARSVIDLMCKEVVELVTDYLSRAMRPEERVRMEQHLLACPPCTAHLAQLRTTLELAGGLNRDHHDVPVDDDLLALFRRRNRTDGGAR
jgi:anti-sigma factor RsiW